MPDQPTRSGLLREATSRKSALAEEADRRTTRRHLFFLAAEAEEIESKTKLLARTSDLSLGGCYLDSMRPFPPGTKFHLGLTRDNQTFRCQAVVMYSHLNMGMGISFMEADTESRALLARWMRELEGEETPQAQPAPELISDTREVRHPAPTEPLGKLVEILLKKGVITQEEARRLTN